VHLIVWQFKCRDGRAADFEKAYDSNGDWARLFARGSGFLGTELLRSSNEPSRYLTIDCWAKEADFETFKAQWGSEYHALDEKCADLSEQEELLGRFTRDR
jgi:heme-degrading monooxygenase HmoA